MLFHFTIAYNHSKEVYHVVGIRIDDSVGQRIQLYYLTFIPFIGIALTPYLDIG
ncbi:MAG: hypothetical protein AAGA43_01885 [Bacteroidota bacterium]